MLPSGSEIQANVPVGSGIGPISFLHPATPPWPCAPRRRPPGRERSCSCAVQWPSESICPPIPAPPIMAEAGLTSNQTDHGRVAGCARNRGNRFRSERRDLAFRHTRTNNRQLQACTNSLCDQLVRSWLVRSWRSKDCNFRCGQHRCGITGITGRTTEIESRRRDHLGCHHKKRGTRRSPPPKIWSSRARGPKIARRRRAVTSFFAASSRPPSFG